MTNSVGKLRFFDDKCGRRDGIVGDESRVTEPIDKQKTDVHASTRGNLMPIMRLVSYFRFSREAAVPGGFYLTGTQLGLLI